ncbi:hypothetical protein BDA99DRAFT_568584 [Phascolomyces articulosus]|uniref:F-box domain-containing protein n=1 Tax=Phascolomyces articulosus TaxID=60185 RepID=A0AAD5K824_9FUNG|nr:hypothetical protein BDA99DRAFT_568584 [Phascolomyces articulosus]
MPVRNYVQKKSLKCRSLPVGGRLDSNDQMLCLECHRKLISDHPNHLHHPDHANVKRVIFRKKEKKKKKQHAVLVSINMSESSGSNIVKTTLPPQQRPQNVKSNSNSNDIDNGQTKMKSITDFLNELPAEILLNVFASFSSEQLAAAALVCTDLYNLLVSDNMLWHHFQLNHHNKAAFIIMKVSVIMFGTWITLTIPLSLNLPTQVASGNAILMQFLWLEVLLNVFPKLQTLYIDDHEPHYQFYGLSNTLQHWRITSIRLS